MKRYGLWRGGERKADVVVLTGGKCIVSWPTSVIVYDSEEAARAVHITHMGGRGEPTHFRPEDDGALVIFRRMLNDWTQDACENVNVDLPKGKSDAECVYPYMVKLIEEYVAQYREIAK